jgi:hypothetical protein
VPLEQDAGKAPVLKTSLYGVDAESPLPTSDADDQLRTTWLLVGLAETAPSRGSALSMLTSVAFTPSTLPTTSVERKRT